MSKRLGIPAPEMDRFRSLLADPAYSQREVAEMMQWPLRRVERLIRELQIPTHPRGRFRGSHDARWKGGRIVDQDGYVLLWTPGHPHPRKHTQYVLEHRLVMESLLGRYLRPSEVVHHRNKQRGDNRPENLQLFGSNAEHLREELTGQVPRWTESGKARIRQGHP
ncbi:MAG TPA: HNH endonuclease, partial [Gemmatimonadales bacterium]|nr:HNH endonuclease [Gemmatimonadales bacterium]